MIGINIDELNKQAYLELEYNYNQLRKDLEKLVWIKTNYGTLKNFIAYMVNQERVNGKD